ncbi:MAG: response regulator transcription factor [Propioniciclava sp.]|uniref:response regulator n=1 Tax=Propioniciclava sp. TaxID=2038686 RepID=UPI0039E399E4
MTDRAAMLVMVVDDHPVVRRGLVALLGTEPWVERVLEADSVAGAERLAAEHPVRLAVVDVGLTDGDGIELTRRLRASHPQLSVLVLTMTADPDLARAALAAGGSGFLVKETDPDILLAALRTVRDGGLVVGPHLPDARQVIAEPVREIPRPFARLTPRELQLVRLVASGAANAQIARRLSITDKTVRNQLSGILVKVGASDRVHLALLARDHGLI